MDILHPNIIYQILAQSDFPSIINICKSDPNITNLCNNNNLFVDLIFEKGIEHYIQRSGNINAALADASASGGGPLVTEFIRRGADPSANYNAAIRLASQYGHLDAVNRLLDDPRVDPSYHNNSAMITWINPRII